MRIKHHKCYERQSTGTPSGLLLSFITISYLLYLAEFISTFKSQDKNHFLRKAFDYTDYYLQITIQAGKYASNFHYQPKKNYQQSLNSKLNPLRKDSNCFLCPQINEQTLKLIQLRQRVKGWDTIYFTVYQQIMAGFYLCPLEAVWAYLHSSLKNETYPRKGVCSSWIQNSWPWNLHSSPALFLPVRIVIFLTFWELEAQVLHS